MKLERIRNHSLQDTLNQIERISRDYQRDLKKFRDCTVYEIFDLLSKEIKFVKDPDNNEFVQRPFYLLKTKQGDCDCKTTFFLAWLRMKKYPCGYSVVSDSDNKPFHHIFPFIYEKKPGTDYLKIIDLDATYPHNKICESKRWVKRKNIFIKD